METIQVIIGVIFGLFFLMGVVALVYNALFDDTNSKKEESKTKNSSSVGKIVVSILIVLVIFMVMGMCTNNNDSGEAWPPRHTYIEKPALNTVNT